MRQIFEMVGVRLSDHVRTNCMEETGRDFYIYVKMDWKPDFKLLAATVKTCIQEPTVFRNRLKLFLVKGGHVTLRTMVLPLSDNR